MQGDGFSGPNGFNGPSAYQLADWRLQMQSLYAVLRAFDNHQEAWQWWNARRVELFLTHPCTPLDDKARETFSGIKLFDYDPKMRFEVDITDEKGGLEYQNIGQDGSANYQQIGKTVGLSDALGKELSVYWLLGYGGGLFVPFRDATNGEQTGKCGRYLIDAIKGADMGLSPSGKLILDFNFSYHPSCAWNEKYVCPLSPAENSFEGAVLAGERQ